MTLGCDSFSAHTSLIVIGVLFHLIRQHLMPFGLMCILYVSALWMAEERESETGTNCEPLLFMLKLKPLLQIRAQPNERMIFIAAARASRAAKVTMTINDWNTMYYVVFLLAFAKMLCCYCCCCVTITLCHQRQRTIMIITSWHGH